MKHFIVLLMIVFLGCGVKYIPTGVSKQLPERMEDVFYSVTKVSEPTKENPYLILKCRAHGTEVKTTAEEYKIERRISGCIPLSTSVLGIVTGLLLSAKGLTVLGRDIEVVTLGSSAVILTYNLIPKGKKWEEHTDRKVADFAPNEPFKIKLSGTKYSQTFVPDKEGNLKINILDFTQYYRGDSVLYFEIFSPTDKSLNSFGVNVESIFPAAEVDANIPETGINNSEGVAVVIGIRDYKHSDVVSVDFALHDAEIMKEYLIKTLGYRPENIIYLENPSKSDFERIFGTENDYKGQLFNFVIPEKSDVFVYYSGHGAPEIETKKVYFVPADCHPDYVRLNGYAMETFDKNISRIQSKSTTVVIDACFSGKSEKGMLIAQASPLHLDSIVIIKLPRANCFTACRPNEIATWYSEKRHGLFTYFFLKGLRGEADKNQDKNITNGELKEYVSENVSYWALRSFNRLQNPTFEGDESKVIVNLK